MQKEFWFYLHWFSHNYSSKLLINLKENQEKGNNSRKNIFFKKLVFGISSDRHSDPKYVVVTTFRSKLWLTVPEQTDHNTMMVTCSDITDTLNMEAFKLFPVNLLPPIVMIMDKS